MALSTRLCRIYKVYPSKRDFLSFFFLCVCIGSSMSILESTMTPFPNAQQHKVISRCGDVSSIWAPCTCSLELCIGWFPCGLKYCKGKTDNTINSNQINSSYRCGIKTCRKCNNFSYYVRQKQQCQEWQTKNDLQ
jgi:Transcriptional regulator, Out at first